MDARNSISRFTFSRFLVLAIAVVSLIPQASAQVVEISDPNLRQAVLEELQLSDGMPITKQEMERLTELSVVEKGITDLNGIGYAKNLVFLDLGGNQIQDISPLVGLTNLAILSLWNTQTQDIAPLAHLTNLTYL